MTNATAPNGPGDTNTMTIRVYTVTREGLITADSGTREIEPLAELPDKPLGFPPCACARHRAGTAAAAP
ncbi:hypothetical protein SAMN05216482_9217 [Streptomyces sp. PAN_FS17]|nr:hypothetical protein SAMN05216482_9217 [Streptomyces sp. PAN_FS17]